MTNVCPNLFLTSKGDCIVTNFDTRKRGFNKDSEDIKINFNNDSYGVVQDGSNSKEVHSVSDMLYTIATLDDNKNEISYNDFKELKKLLKDGKNFLFSMFGIKTVRTDDSAKVASVIYDDGRLIRVKFSSSVKKAKKTNIVSIQNPQPPQPVRTVTFPVAATPSGTEKLPKAYEIGIKGVAVKMHTTKEVIKQKIKKVAENTGYSEFFISHIVSMEHYEPEVVYKENDGTLTGGFGHSNKKDPSLVKGSIVTPELAFKWLTQDIKDFEKDIKDIKLNPEDSNSKTIGDYYNTLPRSIKEAMLDVAFNRGPGRVKNAPEYKHLMANIKGGTENLPSTAVRLRQEFFTKDSIYSTYTQILNKENGPGLMKRNVYRFLLAIRDLPAEYKESAKERFDKSINNPNGNSPSYFSWAKKMQIDIGYPGEAKMLQEAWDNVR